MLNVDREEEESAEWLNNVHSVLCAVSANLFYYYYAAVLHFSVTVFLFSSSGRVDCVCWLRTTDFFFFFFPPIVGYCPMTNSRCCCCVLLTSLSSRRVFSPLSFRFFSFSSFCWATYRFLALLFSHRKTHKQHKCPQHSAAVEQCWYRRRGKRYFKPALLQQPP